MKKHLKTLPKTLKRKRMKSNIFILIIFLLAINGCKKEAKEPLIVTAEAYALPASVAYGGSTTLYWNSTNVISVTKDGTALPTTSGSEDLTSLKKDTTFSFVFKGTDGNIVTKSFLIPVAVKPIPTKVDTLMSLICKSFKSLALEGHSLDGKLLVAFELTEEQKKVVWTYNDDNSWTVDESANGKGVYRTKPGSFGFTEDGKYIWFNDKSNKYEFILTKDTFTRIVPSYDNESNGEKTPIKMYFVQKQ